MDQSSSTFADSKRHYKILDGLRGVAAITVVAFHIMETFSEADHTKQIINHGYLAVDFFFLLSGFVIGYAYDDRWGKISLGNFFKRRLIRLHPMIVAGTLIGALVFYFQASPAFPLISNTPVAKLLLVTLIGLTLLPITLSMDIRGWQEMHPLDGPAWSLFYEYVANLLYALFVRRFSKGWLSVLVFISGAALIHLAVTSPNGDLIGGWSLEPAQIRIGLTRLFYPFFAGLLLQRLAKLTQVKRGFLWCSLLLVLVLAFPRVGGKEALWMNGLYDSLCVVLAFPLIVYLGASSELQGNTQSRLCKFLGDISYPLYITHYPFIYLFVAWTVNNKVTLTGGSVSPVTVWLISAGLLAFCVALSYACLKLYDEPVRRWLTQRLLPSREKTIS